MSKRQKQEEDINDSEEEDRMMRSIRPRFPQAHPLLRVDTGFAVAETPVTRTPFAPTFPATTGPTFDIHKFINYIWYNVNLNDVAGISWAIAQNGVLIDHRGLGDARVASDGLKVMNPDGTTRTCSGSLAKPLCAVAIMKLIEENKLNLSDKAYSKAWIIQNKFPDIHDSIKNITVLQLLTHTSGLQGAAGGWTSNSSLPEFGNVLKKPALPTTYSSYHNSNYWFLGYLIQSVTASPGGIPDVDIGSYVDYIKNMLKQKEYSFAAVSDKLDDRNPCLYYGTGNLSGGLPINPPKGNFPNDDNRGAYGWYGSALDWVAFLVFFRYNRFISEDSKNLMVSPYWEEGSLQDVTSEFDVAHTLWFGFYRFFGQERGTYYGHGGAMNVTPPGDPGDVSSNISPKRGFLGGMMAFPNGIDTALLMNTRDFTYPITVQDPVTILKEAYEAAFHI